jgi:hypothetical protein
MVNNCQQIKIIKNICSLALRPTHCPQPGRLPFKHDQRLKLEQYRSEWAKLPPPGEQKRMALRWRIRELMLRRDM